MKKNITPAEYQHKVQKKVPQSKLGLNCVKAFTVGGIICTAGQVILNFYSSFDIPKDTASALTSMTLILIGIILTATDIYHKIAKHGGAGTLVPITGFANAMSSPAIEAKTEGFILGVGTKLFSIAGPVIAYGTAASVVAGFLMYFFG